VLKTRVLTALVVTLIGVTALFGLPPVGFAVFAMVVLLALGGWEGAHLAGVTRMSTRVACAAMLALLGAGIYLADPGHHIVLWLLPVCLLWLALFAWLGSPGLGDGKSGAVVTAKLMVISLILLGAWLAVTWLQTTSPWYVFLLLIVIASADVGAFFCGRHFGGAKLAPRISPGKTRSGAIGGLVSAFILTALVAMVIPVSPFPPALAGLLAVGLALVSIGGDLFFSLLKRQAGIKDSSSLLPGHGGILDRMDSLGAGLPFFALAVAFYGP
jgi:phosphatidate cytidylyltransferase